MSANPTHVDWEATTPDPGPPLQEGNRVIESIGRQEAVRALRAFSELHEQIRNRRMATGRASDRDLFETERFILDEVLQLICDRALAIAQADGIVVALAESPEIIGPTEMVCRAAAGDLGIRRGIYLIGESEFLRECLETGRILRSDDCEIDTRVELDFARAIGARSTVLVPLGGWREPLGVLQAFSTTAWAFSDDDVRCFDLFAELVLSALKPEDQDRRIDWLSGVANEILGTKPPAAATLAPEPAETEVPQSVVTGLAPSPVPEPVSATEQPVPAAISVQEAIPELAALTDLLVVPEDLVEWPGPAIELAAPSVATESLDESPDDILEIEEPPTPAEQFPVLPFLEQPPVPAHSRAGWNMVMGLIAVVALFSAGVWWGMQMHGKTDASPTGIAASSPSPSTRTNAVSDNLMNPAQAGSSSSSDAAALTAMTPEKLAALPKVTGVRHWSSSMGSTVVIDMDDQVPYEVHRLMSPERIYFDLHDTALAPDLDGKTMEVGDQSLVRVRMAQPVAGVTRVVLDTKDGSNFAVSMESSPYRLVVELRGSEKTLSASQFAPKAATAKLTAASVNPAPTPAKAAPVAQLATPAKTGKFRIVLDAGHGGWDRGTVGQQGLMEKDLVLDVTQRLGKLLQARLGSEVMFTRTDDTYLALDQRADFANQSQADVFVSVHANYSSSASARGVETYYTNVFSAPGSRESEKRDDGTAAKLTPASLSADELREKTERSRRLAESVQRSLYGTVAATSPDIRNRGIKDSSFAVLTGTTMPAILTEISFVSSPADETKLQSESYRQQIAEALYQGIAHYQQASSRAKVAQLQTASTRR
ncbi:MAG: N-acetylmuramoyl-L-alanine amidase [Terriglobales bacterium]